jgi:PAS domain S-box-containing protein
MRLSLLFQKNAPARYVGAAALVVAGWVIRLVLESLVGPGLPPYITLYPVVMLAGLLGGFGPGLFATVAAALMADYWLLPPVHSLKIENPLDAASLLLFIATGFFMTLVAHFYRRAQVKVRETLRQQADQLENLVASRTENLNQTNEKLARQIELLSQAQGQRRVAQELFTTAFANNPAGIALTLLDAGTVLDVNETWTAMTGYSREEVLGQSARHIWPTAEAARRFVAELKDKGRLRLWEQEFRHKSGGTYVTQISAQVLDLHGEKLILSSLVDITERKRAEHSLRESEERFRMVFEHAITGISITDRQGRFERCNPAYCTMLGYSAAELSQMDFQSLVHPADRATNLAESRRLWAGELPHFEIENRYMRRDGSTLFVRKFVSLLPDESGKPTRVLALVTDVTAQRQAEAALREREAQWRLFIEHSPAAIAMLDHHLRYLAVSRQWLVDYHLVGQELCGRRHCEIFPEIPARWKEIHRRCLAGAIERMDEDLFERADGVRQWLRWEIRPWHLASGEVGGIIIFTEDITERKQIEQELEMHRRHLEELVAERTAALRLSEQEFRSLAESVPQIVWATRPDGWNIYFNQQWMDYTGMTLQESCGHGWNTPFHPEDKQRAWEAWQRATKFNEHYSLECRLRRADGLYRWWLIRGVPMYGADGGILKWFGTCTDIEELKHAEAALKEANDRLEDRVAERTAALSASEERFRALVTTTSDVVYRMSPGWTEMRHLVGQNFIADTQGPDDDWLGKYIHPDDQPRVLAAINQAIRTKSAFELEHRVIRVDGSLGWTFSRAVPILDGHGEIIEWFGAMSDVTARRQAEARLRRFFETDLFAVLYWRIDGGVVDVNDQFLKLTGYSREDLRAGRLNWAEITPEEFQALDEDARRQMRETGVHRPYEKQFIRKDGTRVWGNFSAAAYNDDRTEGISLILDVTSRKQVEEQLLLRSTALFNAANGIVITDAGGTIQWVNQAFEDLTGYSAAEAIGQNPRVLNSGVHPRAVFEKLWQTILAGRVWRGEVTNKQKDGNHYEEEMTITPFSNSQGKVTHFIAIKQDITERKRTGEALRRSEERLRTVVSSIRSGLLLVTEDDQVAFTNQAFCDYFKLSQRPSDLAGLTAREMIENIRGAYAQPEEQIARIREIVRQQAPVLGEEVNMQGGRSCLRDFIPISLNGSSFGRLWMHTDITERKLTETALARAKTEVEQKNQELERRVAERTANLQQMLAEMEQFTYVASHDLQEPLRTVSSFSQLLALRYHGKLDADADEFIAFVVEAAKRMQNLIIDLLALSRIGTRGRPFAPVSGDQILQAARENLTVAIQESGAQITHEPLPELVADETQLVQLFQNLIGNAIKFRRPGEAPHIHVSARRQNESWQWSIRDNGIGIDPQFFDRIFVVFQRLHTREDYPGTGIGLAICKKIVERHGGRLWVESAVGKGATFHFTIPIATPILPSCPCPSLNP